LSTPESFLQPRLLGPTLELRPLRADDFEPLYAAASDPLIWAGHPSRDRYQRPVFQGWFADALASGGALVVLERATGTLIGSSRYYEWQPQEPAIAIGYTFLSRAFWGGAANAEMKRLMLDHAFGQVRTVWFHVAADNVRSQKAMAKIGATLSHRAVKQLTGGPADYLFFKIESTAPWRSAHSA
jgi:RimJ/RimL family protein N-acetyltransferase